MSKPGVPVKSQKNTFLRKEEITGLKIENQKEKNKRTFRIPDLPLFGKGRKRKVLVWKRPQRAQLSAHH